MCIKKIAAWLKDLYEDYPDIPIPPPEPPPPPPPSTVLIEIKEDCVVFTSSGPNDKGLPIIDVNTGIKTKIGERWQVYYPFALVDSGNKAGEVYRRFGSQGVWGRGAYIPRSKFKRV